MKKKISLIVAVMCIFSAVSTMSAFAVTDFSTEIVITVEETTSAVPEVSVETTTAQQPTTVPNQSTTSTVQAATQQTSALSTADVANGDKDTTVIKTGQRMVVAGVVLFLATLVVAVTALWKKRVKVQTKNNRQSK